MGDCSDQVFVLFMKQRPPCTTHTDATCPYMTLLRPPPCSSCRRKWGTTEPLEPSTLPKRTMVKIVSRDSAAIAWSINSQMRFVAPMIFVGRTALSVLTRTKRSTLQARAASAVASVTRIRTEEHTSELKSLMRTWLAVYRLKTKKH